MLSSESQVLVELIDSVEQFTILRDNWKEIYSLDKDAGYFLSWNWLSQLYELRDEGVFIFAVKLPGVCSRYCAFFPLRQEVRFSQSRQRFYNSYCMAGNYWADSTGLIIRSTKCSANGAIFPSGLFHTSSAVN